MRMPLDDDEGQLVLAIYEGDLERAKSLISMLACRKSAWARRQQIARAAASPPRPLPELEPFPLPMPGHGVGSTLGEPRVERPAA